MSRHCPRLEWLEDESDFEPDVQAEHYRGTHIAIRRCGEWPDIGTVAEYLKLADQAEREADFVMALWARYARRPPYPHGKRLELASARCYARSQTAAAIASLRRTMLDNLLNNCMGQA